MEEFLQSFGETLAALSDDAFRSHVTALVKLKQCEDTHLGEEVERHWNEVITQQYVYDRLHHEVSVSHIHNTVLPKCVCYNCTCVCVCVRSRR